MLQITDHILLPEGRMDGVIVAVAHDEFRGWGFEDLREFMDEGAEHYAKFKNEEL